MAIPESDLKTFREFCDEFKHVSNLKLEIAIGVAKTRVDQAVWGDVYQYAWILLAAHLISVSGGAGGSGGAAGGAMTAEATGDLSRAYAKIGVAGSGDEELQSTQYGAQFVALRRETIVSMTVTGDGVVVPPLTRC